MLLAVDIGNTNINLGLFAGKKLLKRFTVPTRPIKYSAHLYKIIRQYQVKDALVCSVVPAAAEAAEKALKRGGVRVYNIGKDIEVPIKNLYRRPKQVGQDRLVNAYAAVSFYGAPLVVVDFGTAVTFDIISRKKEYLGGMILPGLRISLDALYQRTALLPRVKLARPGELIGRDTQSSILSGIVYGFASLADQIGIKMKKKLGRGALFIGTGGDIKLIAGYCSQLDKIDPDLTLKGLNLLHRARRF